MARSGTGLLLLSVVTVAFAGCLDDEAPRAPDAAYGTGSGDAFDLPPAPDEAEARPSLLPPEWSVGDSWRYAVDGAWVERPYTARIGVVAVEPDRYVLGTDSVEEVVLDVVHGGLFTRGIARETLAVWDRGQWQEIIRFGVGSEATWTTGLYGQVFTMRAVEVAELPGVTGGGPGIRAIGTSSEGHRLVVDHHADPGTYTRFVLSRGDEVLLQYRFLDAAEVAPEGLSTWRVAAAVHAEASSIAPVGTRTWSSDGTGDLLVLVGSADPARAGRATVWDPQVAPALAVVADPDLRVKEVVALRDATGSWRLAATSLGADVSVSLYQVDTSGPLGLGDPSKTSTGTGILPELPLVERLPVVGGLLG